MNLKTSLSICFAFSFGLGGCGSGELGVPGPAGPAGPEGATGPVEPKLNALLPTSAFLARTMSMQLSGVGTHFSASSKVDFGDPQITTTQIVAGSDDNLQLTVLVGQTAKLGAHDVTVTTGSESVKLVQSFTVSNALLAEPVAQQPTISQGGLYAFDLRNLDYRTNPFLDTTAVLNGFSVADYLDIGSPGHIKSRALIDAMTPAGLLAIDSTIKDPFGNPLYYSTTTTDASLAMVSTRTPTTLVNNTPVTGQALLTNNATNLYKLTTAAASQLLILSYSSVGTALSISGPSLKAAIAPASGKFSSGTTSTWTWNPTSMTGQILTVLATASDYYLSVYRDDFGGGPIGNTYTLTPKLSTLSKQTNTEPMATETPANPSLKIASLTGAVAADDGTISAATDNDYVIFTAAATGPVLLQIAVPPAPNGAFGVAGYTVYSDAACTSFLNSNMVISGGSFLTSLSVTSGQTYCVKLSGSVGYTPLPYKVLLVP